MKRVEISEDVFIKDALNVVQACQDSGVTVRIIGSLCGYMHNLEHDGNVQELYRSLGRLGDGNTIFTDLDLMAYSGQRGKVVDVFEKNLGLVANRYFNLAHGHQRLIYEKPGAFGIDLFFDRLEYSHNVEFGKKPETGRLQLDFPTISLADFVLEKLQIHQINRKDLVDLVLLLNYHNVSEQAKGQALDGNYIAQTLSDDWGFWYDATQNIQKVRDFAASITGQGISIDLNLVLARLNKLSSIIEAYPKGERWRQRAKAGTSKPWFVEVGDVTG